MAIEPITVGMLGFGLFFLLILIGVRMGFAALLTGVAGLWLLAGAGPALHAIGNAAYGISATYEFAVIPLFVVMGFFAQYAGFADEAFETARKWVGNWPGGLLVATVLGGAAFGAACGSSVASAGVLTKVALPELEKYGYDSKLSVGCIVATGTLAIMIPPSATMVIYCILVEQSVTKMLIAGILPGLLTAAFFSTFVILRALLKPSLAPRLAGVNWKSRLISLKGTWGILSIAAFVMGGLYSGLFTPSEAAAAGAMFTLLVAFIKGRLRWSLLRDSLLSTLQTTCMVLIIIIGVIIFSRFLAYTRVTYVMSAYITALPVPPMAIVGGIMVLFFFLGMFMEPIGMMALTLPVLYPTIQALGVDPILFGILVIKGSELSMETPPIGLNLFVVSGLAPHIPLHDIWKGAAPFIVIDCLLVIVLMAFPQIVLFLPSKLG